ncbi:VOC family protein [Amaricoccus sp.]|uniref:VOC family protein n=1 Tax=Amaricoccus sp. TaxID=1872485 RepID=UPI001B44CBAD|nr:VOC family protein [Amaricoccus sp.]MBP7001379.1 VOC family protein [Amaricoccus sp.]
MISHVHLGTADLDRACAFYDPVMAALGFPPRFHDAAAGWAGWSARDGGRPFLLVGRPFDGATARPGNGQMVALEARSRAEVDRAHAVALALGGTDEGAPGLRPRYHADYYGAYVRDPDGNKLCFVCHAPAAPE